MLVQCGIVASGGVTTQKLNSKQTKKKETTLAVLSAVGWRRQGDLPTLIIVKVFRIFARAILMLIRRGKKRRKLTELLRWIGMHCHCTV